MSIQVQVRDRGQIVATLRVLDEATVQGEGILYADVDADALLEVARAVQAGREAVFTPAPAEQLVTEADKATPPEASAPQEPTASGEPSA